ncbi:MAG: hypothetical protein RL189_2510, partial [Pseudomonadota bacterium]
ERAGRVAFAIEIKSTKNLTVDDFKALRLVGKDFIGARRIVLCQEERPRVTEDNIEVFPWAEGIEQILH